MTERISKIIGCLIGLKMDSNSKSPLDPRDYTVSNYRNSKWQVVNNELQFKTYGQSPVCENGSSSFYFPLTNHNFCTFCEIPIEMKWGIYASILSKFGKTIGKSRRSIPLVQPFFLSYISIFNLSVGLITGSDFYNF